MEQARIDRIRDLVVLNGADGIGVKVLLLHDGEWYENDGRDS